ncbi:unnamed protein product [Microthlaspi erraticum]|uniref:Uncharacterized protein n=1 Tax=Microthlaspi erraticum TaxID=1685480 RepID=A0A6D2KFT6_9BRAS|nr:unnamed protein product [Microthlaspi erraticum]
MGKGKRGTTLHCPPAEKRRLVPSPSPNHLLLNRSLRLRPSRTRHPHASPHHHPPELFTTRSEPTEPAKRDTSRNSDLLTPNSHRAILPSSSRDSPMESLVTTSLSHPSFRSVSPTGYPRPSPPEKKLDLIFTSLSHQSANEELKSK